MKKLICLTVSLFLPLLASESKELPAWKKSLCRSYAGPLPADIETYAKTVARDLGVRDVVFHKSFHRTAFSTDVIFNEVGLNDIHINRFNRSHSALKLASHKMGLGGWVPCASDAPAEEPSDIFKKSLYHELCHVKNHHHRKEYLFSFLLSGAATAATLFLVNYNKDKCPKLFKFCSDWINRGFLVTIAYVLNEGIARNTPTFPGNVKHIYSLSQEMEAELFAHYHLYKRDNSEKNFWKNAIVVGGEDNMHPSVVDHTRYIDELLRLLKENPESNESIVRSLSWKYFCEKMSGKKMV